MTNDRFLLADFMGRENRPIFVRRMSCAVVCLTCISVVLMQDSECECAKFYCEYAGKKRWRYLSATYTVMLLISMLQLLQRYAMFWKLVTWSVLTRYLLAFQVLINCIL